MTYQSLSEQDSLGGLSNLFAIEYHSELDLLLRDYWEEGTETIEREGDLDLEPIMGEVSKMLSWRTAVLAPYLHALGSKQDAGHNCALCSGRCDMQHSMIYAELEESQNRFLCMMHKLPVSRLAGLAILPGASLSTVRALRILATTAELVHAERHYLIPFIHQARKNIYADVARED